MHIEISHGETVTAHLPGGGLVTVDAWNYVITVEGASPDAAQWLVQDRRGGTPGGTRRPESEPAAAPGAAAIRAAFDSALDAARSSPDAVQAFRDLTALGELVKHLEIEAASCRARHAARLASTRGLSVTKIAGLLGMSRSRAAQLVTAGRRMSGSQRRGGG